MALCASSLSATDLDPLPVDLLWLHAVNSPERVASYTERVHMVSAPVSVGVEIDVHAVVSHVVAVGPCTSHNLTAVCRHDAVPLEKEVPLRELLQCIDASLTPCCRIEVLKLDVKSPAALLAVLELQRDVQRTRQQSGDSHNATTASLLPDIPPHRVWLNADVVQGPHLPPPVVSSLGLEPDGDSGRTGSSNVLRMADYLMVSSTTTVDVPFTGLDPAVLAMTLAEAARTTGWGLSLGWTTSPSDFTPYNDRSAQAMLRFLKCMRCATSAEGAPVLHTITFPVRHSLVYTAAGVSTDASAALRWLCRAVVDEGLAQTAFLTFWRGRTERIDAQSVSTALSDFPGCTVDSE